MRMLKNFFASLRGTNRIGQVYERSQLSPATSVTAALHLRSYNDVEDMTAYHLSYEDNQILSENPTEVAGRIFAQCPDIKQIAILNVDRFCSYNERLGQVSTLFAFKAIQSPLKLGQLAKKFSWGWS